MSFLSRIKNRLLFESHWRCKEPVVVIESDDWGLERKPCAELLAGRGEVTDWALESTESADDLAKLFQVLLRHTDRAGRPACLTANFIMSNPDYDAIAAGGYETYTHIDLNRSCPLDRRAKYREGMSAGCFIPQYHGLRHLHPEALLRDLRADVPGARALFDFRAAAGLSMVKGSLWRYHSEYQDWSGARPDPPSALLSTIEAGIDSFEQFFGFRPQSVISPHYLVSDTVFPAWRKAGIHYVQGGNYQLRACGGEQAVRSDRLGAPAPDGLLFLCRNVKLEPRPSRREDVAQALESARQCFEAHIPVVVDTHRINYTGQFRERGLEALDRFLSEVARRNPLFLTSAELGAAIDSDGRYTDQRLQEVRTLCPEAGTRTFAARMAAALT